MSKTISSKSVVTTTTASFHANQPRQRIAQNFLLIWLDANIDESKQDWQNTLAQLRSVVNDINIFTQRDEAIDFLTEVNDMKTFLIVESTIGQDIVPLIHDISQLDTIYSFCDTESLHKQWTKKWAKIKDVYTDIKPICEALKMAAKQFNQDSIAVSFVPVIEVTSNADLNQLEPSFMYTQIFKEILLEMDHDEKSIKDFIQFWRQDYINNTFTLNIIAEFERDYSPQSAIRWYTRESFLYQMLNQSLRMLEGDTIINMGFFIRDLHQQIKQLHQKQIGTYHEESFTVYRGQGLSKIDFEKLQKSKGGLMSFNNFLSTSKDRDISLMFAESALGKTDMIGIFFTMTINPSISSAPFASIREVSYYNTEEEILFSMHTVFRIGEITKIDKNSSLYQVDLKLTADDDQQLRTLTERINEDVRGGTGWQRLGFLLTKIGQFDKAEELSNVLLEQTSDDNEKARCYNQLGYIRKSQGDFKKGIKYYEKSIEIWQKILPPNHPSLATSYNNIGMVYMNMVEYSKALSFYEKAREVVEKTLPTNYPLLAASYNNIGLVHYNMGQYSKALSFYEKSLKISEKTLPPNHPDLAQSYNNIGTAYYNIGEYSKALLFFEKSLEIRQKTLPPNHPSLAESYNNSGVAYHNMGECSKALLFFEKACEIQQKTLLPNHPELTISYNNIGMMYMNMKEYSKALLFFEKACEIQQKTLPPNHLELTISYNNIGMMYMNMGEYSKALSFFEKACEIQQKTLPPNHPDLAISYNNTGRVYTKMGEYSKALSFFQRVQNIWQRSLPSNHSNMKTLQRNLKRLEDILKTNV